MKYYIRRFALWLLHRVDSCPTCQASWLSHRCPYVVTTEDTHVCGHCFLPLPIDAIRTHDGKWRCADHKGL